MNVQASTESQVGNDMQFNYPFGLLSFKLTCSTAGIKVYYHDGENLENPVYRKFGPTTPGVPSTTKFYTLPGVMFSTVNLGGASDPVLQAMFTLNDNQLGDATGLDGMILDPGGPATIDLSEVAPVASPFGIAVLVFLLTGVAAFGFWRAQRSRS